MIVWFAATGKNRKVYLYPVAILLHAVLDAVAVLAAKSGMSLIIVEALIWLIAIGIVLIARGIWKKETKEKDMS